MELHAPDSATAVDTRHDAYTSTPASSQVLTFAPGEGTDEQLVMEKLGKNGWGRWQYFRKCFSQSWGESNANALHPKSQTAFLATLKDLDFSDVATPSLFLTEEGFLELAWEDAQGSSIQIEFGDSESEIYIESLQIEKTVLNSELTHAVSSYLS